MAERSRRASRALAHVPEVDPALAALALWCHTADHPERTQTVGDTIYFGPDFETLPLREQLGLLGHHVLHIALRHSARMSGMARRMGDGFEQNTYNLAADAVVNACLEQAGHALPRPSVKLEEVVRDVLRQDPADALQIWDVDKLYGALRAQDAAGRARLLDYLKESGFQADMRVGEADDGDVETERWSGHLIRAVESDGATGRGIGAVLGKIADLPRAETPWEQHLRRMLARATSQVPRRSYRRPRSAWIATEAEARVSGGPVPVFEPGQARDSRRPRIVIAADSSGSISDPVLSLFAAEVTGISRRTGAECHLLAFDDTVYATLRLSDGDVAASLRALEWRREGGTAFVDVMAQASALAPSIIVVLTDLEGQFGTPPDCPVIWATERSSYTPPPFGTVLSLGR